MRFWHRSPTRRAGVAMVCLLVLALTGCSTLGMPPSLAPGPDPPGSGTPRSGSSGRLSSGNVAAIVTIAVLGGFLLYRFFFHEPEEEDAGSPPESSRSLPDGGSSLRGKPEPKTPSGPPIFSLFPPWPHHILPDGGWPG
jgi:hypothetical protein